LHSKAFKYSLPNLHKYSSLSKFCQAAQPNSYDLSFSGVRAGEFNTSVASYVQSRDQSGQTYSKIAA